MIGSPNNTRSKDESLLVVRDLRVSFATDDGLVRAVDGVSFRVDQRQCFALVGESGCGKSVTAMSAMRLLQTPPANIVAESLSFDGGELLPLPEERMRSIRGRDISMIFQEPMTSLNPVYPVGEQIAEAIRLHQREGARAAWRKGEQMLAQVGIPEPARRMRAYPHQMSGGMRQRVMIAMALSCNPRLLIADEPTTALDVTIQAQILDLLGDLKESRGLSVLLITHDLGVVAETADVVAVMYAGCLAELAAVGELYERPLHPYTQGLFRSVPKLGEAHDRLETIDGVVPSPLNPPTGCRFHPRCPVGRDLPRCRKSRPELREVSPGHWAACWECAGYGEAAATDPSASPIRTGEVSHD